MRAARVKGGRHGAVYKGGMARVQATWKKPMSRTCPSRATRSVCRGLPAAYSNEAQSKSLKVINTANGDQVATMDQGVLEVLQFAHGCVDPAFSEDEARTVSTRFGPAFKKVIAEIDRLSGVNKEALETQAATFPAGERRENGHPEAVAVEPSAVDG